MVSKAVQKLSIMSVIAMFAVTCSIVIIIMQANAARVQAQDGNMNMDMNPLIMHIHPQLTVLVNNSPINVPAQIGIDPSLWNDHSLDEYGMQAMPEMNMSAMSPLHTHDESGTVHVESTINRDYTIGEFLSIWGMSLDGKAVKMTVDGKPIADFKGHILSDGEQIILEVR